MLRKVRALSRKWFSKARRAARKAVRGKSKSIRTASAVGNKRPYTSEPYNARSGTRTSPLNQVGEGFDLSRPTNESALDQLSRGAISTFGSDIQSLLSEGKDVLKSLHGDFFSEKGYEAGEESRSVFKTFYDMPSGTYTGLNRSQAWGEDEDAFSYSLRQRTTEIVDVLVSKDTLPATQLQTRMSRLNSETRTLSQRGTFGTLGDPYIRRPGVGLIVDVIDQADREIVIDLYQLQNRTVLDALEQKVRETPGIKVSVRLSLPDEGTQGQKGFDILGPNLLSLERLRRVKEALGERGDIELFVQDRKSHQKVMVTDKFGVIGSLNLTAPVGNDVNQAGSNYEVVRRLQTREYSEEQYRNQGMTPTREEEVLISSSNKLFKQLQESVGNRDALRKDPTEQLRLNQGQIVGSAETYEHLRETLDMMRSPSDKKFYGILNQVFLLYHEDTMFNEMLHGEMGKFDSPSTVRGPIMKGIQTELLDLVIGNRAFLAIDNRNYSEHVLTPMYERTEAIFKGTGLPINSLEELVSRVGYDVSNPVKSFMQRVEAVTGNTLAEGFNESYARQLLAMTSGNIRLTTVPMQHSKQYLVLESQQALSFQSGSANPGPFSLHAPEFNTSPEEIERTNREFGLALIQGKARTGPHSLSQEELNAELELARQSFSKDWGTLTRTELGDVQGRPTSAWYEDKVDRVRLGELHARLTELTTTLGVGEVSYKYGGKSGTERIGLSLSMDARQLAGFGEGFERVQGNGPRFRWDYTTLAGGMGGDEGYVLDITKGRVISRSLIHNSSAASLNIRVEDISRGIGQDVLLGRAEALNKKFVTVAPNKAAVMNPIGTTLSLVSTLLLESTNRLLVWGPEQYLSHLSEGERRTLVQKYLDSFTPTGDLIQQAGESDRSSITNLSDTLARRLRGDVDGALQKARAWTGQEVRGKGVSNELGGIIDNVQHLLSSMSYGYTASEYEQYKLENKSDVEARASVPISDKDLSKARIERAGSYSSDIVDMLVPLLDTSADFRLAVVQATVAQSNASYTEILSSGINKMSGAMMEPFLLSAQVSQYSGSQGWFRLPMYSATNEYQEVLQRLEGTPQHALASQALAIPRAFSPYSSVGIPGLHRDVAGGTNNEGTSTDTGLTLFGQKGTTVDTVVHHRVTSSMGVGFSTTRGDILSSTLSDKAKVRALAVFNEQGSDELLTYMFGGKGKVAQIPQRLKNTQGQRGMGKLTQALTTAMDGTGPDFLASAREYGKDLGQGLREKLVRKNPTWTPHQVEQYVDRIMPEQDVVLAASFAMSVRGVMSSEQVVIMEAYEASLMELGLDIEDFNEGGIGHELVRMRAISSDVMSTGMKGFTSSPSFALVQMAGMYSDYFYANPDASPMEGNLRTTTKKVKASMLGVAWTRADAGGQELASARDVVMFDESLQKVIVVNHITGAVTNHELSSLTEGDILALPKEVIDDRGQRSVLEAMIENKGREIGRSSASTITTTGWVRPGEDSKEYLLSMRALPGGGGNQLFYELTYVQAKSPSGGSRVDSGTSLFKGVAVFLTSAYFENIAALRKGKPSDNVLGEIESKDIFGLINPSNLKSFSLEHGGTLLREGKASIVLDALSEREAAVAMLLAFGSNYIDTPDKGALSSALYEALREMPGVYKETALQIGLRQGPEVGGRELLSSLDKAWNPASMYSLMDITGEQMLSALSGKSGGIKSALSELMSKGTKSSKYLNVDNAMERQAATILTALDITRQLMRNERVSPGDVSYRSDVMEQLMSIVGLSEAPEEELAQAMVRGLSQSVASVYLKMDLAYSSSKEPIGTKGTGALQNADLVRPFTQIAKEFTEGGDLSKLRVVLANMLVSTATTETATMMMSKLQGIEDVEIRSVFDPQLFTPLAMSRNLGIYGSGMEDITALKELYKDYGAAVQTAIEERVTAIAGGVGDARTLGSELSTLLFEASNPSSIDTQSLLGSMWRDEYSTSLSAIQEVGRRYELLATKAFGVGEAEAIAREMSHDRGIYHLPAVVFDSMPSESGRIIARFDDVSPGTSFYLPSAEDLRTYGIQYGSYTDELVRSTLTLASAFSPGTAIGNIFSTLSKVKAMGASSVEFTADEVKALQNYYVTAYGIVERIAEASTGTRLKMEARLRGFVGTFAATFGLPQGMFLAPEEGMRGAGDVRDSLRRQRLEEVTRSLSDPASRDSMRLLKAERDALMGGMGEKGSMLLRTVQGDVEYITRNPLLQKEYIAARLWTIQDANHVSALMETRSGIGVSQVQADRITQEIKDYTRSRVGTENIPNLPGVRSYRDIVGAREGNEGNYYVVELGEQALRSASGVWENSYERTVNPPALESWLRSKKIYEGSERRARLALDDQYVSSKDKPYRLDPYTSITPSLLIETAPNELPPLGRLSRVLEQGVAFTGTYRDITLKKGTLTRLREAEGSVTSQLEYQRRQFDKAFNTSSRELRKVEGGNDYQGEYGYLQSKLYGYNREGAGLKEQVINLERMLETNGPLEYGRRKLDKAFNASKYALQSAEREYGYLQSKLYGYNREGAGLNEQVINLQRMLDTEGPLEYGRRKLDKAFNASKYALQSAEREYGYLQSKLYGYNREGAGLNEQVINLERMLETNGPLEYGRRKLDKAFNTSKYALQSAEREYEYLKSKLYGYNREGAGLNEQVINLQRMLDTGGPLEYQRRQLDKAFNASKYALEKAERQYEYQQSKLHGYNREGAGLDEQVRNLERILDSGKTPFDYKEKQYRYEVQAWEWELRKVSRAETNMQSQIKGISGALYGKEVEVDREWAHWSSDASLESPISHVEGTQEAMGRQLISLQKISGQVEWASQRIGIFSSISEDQFINAEGVWGPYRTQERLRSTDSVLKDRYENTIKGLDSELDIAFKRMDALPNNKTVQRGRLGRLIGNLVGTKKNIQGQVRLGSASTGYSWYRANDTLESLTESRDRLVGIQERIEDSLERTQIKTERLMGYLPSTEELEALSKRRMVAEDNLRIARDTLADPVLNEQRALWRAEKEEQLAQARTKKSDTESALKELGMDLVTLKESKVTRYEEYVEGLKKYEIEKPVWRAEKQEQLVQARTKQAEVQSRLYELRGDSLTGAGGELEALRIAKDTSYEEYVEGLKKYEIEKPVWRAEKQEQLVQARTKQAEVQSRLYELRGDSLTGASGELEALRIAKDTSYEEYIYGLNRYEAEKPVWRAEKQEQLVQARTKQAEVQSRLYELRGDSLTGAGGELEALRIAKDTSYEEYIYGLNRYEAEKPVWRAEKQGQLAQARISVQEAEDKLYEVRGDSLTGEGGKLEALRAAKDRKYSEYEKGLRRYELEKQRASSYNEEGGTWFKRYSVGGDSQLRVSESGDGNYYRKYETVESSWTGKQRDKVTRLRGIVERQQIAADPSRRENATREWEGLSSRTETISSFMVGGEEYANREQAMAAGEKVVPNKNLIEQLGGAINADSMGQWQGSIRGRIETYRIDRSLFQGLGMGESRELLADSVERSKVSIDELLVSLERVDSAYGYDSTQKELIETSRTELRELSSALDTLHKGRGEWTSIETPLARMESLQVSLNTSDVLQATVFRSAPFGSTELQRQQFTAVGLVKNLNVYLESQGMSQLDESRNKSLGLMPVMSGHALGLLDYDGDNFTVIFSKIGTAMNDRQRLADKVKSNTLRQGMLRKQASSNGGEYLDEYWLASDEYRIANEEIGMRINAIDAEMSSVRDTLVQTYDPLLRKEVSSYLGVSQSFMSEYQEKPISMEVLPTYLQQSRGLFGGVQGVAHDNSIMALHATMESIHATDDFKSALDSLKQGASISEALSTSNIDTSVMLKDVSDNHFRELLTNNPSLRTDVITKMMESILAKPGQNVSSSLMEGAAQLSSSEVAVSNYSKYMGMGSGASMSPTVYDMLTKTLGVAGGDILGKSYNALVGTLFRDSPLIALSHVLSGEGGSTVMDSMKEYYAGTTMADDVEGTFNQVHVEAKRAESLQAFMKSAQQLLRDSIKFKGDTDVLGDLQKAHGEYQKYIDQGDDASARLVLSEMAGKLGPGPGLKSYMQLGTLIETSSNNVYGKPLTGIDDSSIAFLSKEYKISSNEEVARLSNEMRDRGVDVSEGTIGDVVRYKVARDMRATITAFRYELGSQDNQPFLDTVWSGIRGFLGVGEDADRDEAMDRKFISNPSLKADIGAALSKDANEWWGEASSKNKALMLALVDEGRKQTDAIFGSVGEGLNQFVTLETLRKKAGKLGGGRSTTMSGISTELADTDITIALMNSSMNGIDPEAASHYMTVMKDFMGDSTGMEQVLGQTQGGRNFLELNSVGGVGVRVINKKDGGIRVGYHDEPLGEGESYRKFNVRNSDGDVVGEHNSPMGFLDAALEATSTGQRRRLLDNIGDAFNSQTMHSDQSWAGTISSALGASLPEAEVLSATIRRLSEQKVSKGMSTQQASQEAIVEAREPVHQAETREIRGREMGDASAPIISAALRAQAVTSNPPRAVLTGMNPGAQAASHVRHSQEMHDAVGRMHDMNDMVLGAGLTLLGSLMATGSINENTIGEVVGGTVSMLGYSQMGRPGVASVLGQSFRARMAHAESKGSQDEGEWVRRWVGREVGFFVGAAVIAPAIMGGAERILSKFSPLRVDRPMDVDRYKGWKAAANTLGGAVLSSVLGMLTSVIGGEVAVHGTNLIPSLGIVESFVRSMSETESKRQDMIGERLAQVGEGTVMDDDGDPMRAAIEVSYVMDNPTTDFSAYPTGESDYSEGDDWEVNVVG